MICVNKKNVYCFWNSVRHSVMRGGWVIGTASNNPELALMGCTSKRKCCQIHLWAEGPLAEQCALIGSALWLDHQNIVHQSVLCCSQIIGTACANRYCAAARSSEQRSPIGSLLRLGHPDSIRNLLVHVLGHVPGSCSSTCFLEMCLNACLGTCLIRYLGSCLSGT